MVGVVFKGVFLSLRDSFSDKNRKELISCGGLEAQLSLIKGRLLFALFWWIACAMYSLPVPDSPRKSRGLSD